MMGTLLSAPAVDFVTHHKWFDFTLELLYK